MISVCLPTKNAGPEFARNLRAWRDQHVQEEVELVVVDSGSGDATLQTARELGARVLTIAPEEFNHGETRNFLARQARGDLLVFSVQDAWPADDFLLAQLTEPLREDAELAGVTGKQVPRPDADLFARRDLEGHNAIVDKGRCQKRMTSIEDFLRSDFLQRFACLAFDNVCSAIPRRVWGRFPFSRVEFAEDLDWSFRVLAAGGCLLYNPAARIFHSHNHAPYQRLKRSFVSGRALYRLFRMPPEFGPLAEEDVLEDIGAFLADLESAHTALLGHAQPPQALRLPRSGRHLLRQGLKRTGLPGARRLARRLRRGAAHGFLRYHFNAAASHLVQSFGPLSSIQATEAVLQLGCQTLGDFLGCYYHSCEQAGTVPDWLEEQAERWARGV